MISTAFAIAFGLAGIAGLMGAFNWWRNEDELLAAAAVGIPSAAFVYAAADHLVRVIA